MIPIIAGHLLTPDLSANLFLLFKLIIPSTKEAGKRSTERKKPKGTNIRTIAAIDDHKESFPSSCIFFFFSSSEMIRLIFFLYHFNIYRSFKLNLIWPSLAGTIFICAWSSKGLLLFDVISGMDELLLAESTISKQKEIIMGIIFLMMAVSIQNNNQPEKMQYPV